jgi:hypothetical protein
VGSARCRRPPRGLTTLDLDDEPRPRTPDRRTSGYFDGCR